MISGKFGAAAFCALGLACLLGPAGVAHAQGFTAPNSPSAHNEWKGASTGLGSSHRFADKAAAENHCPSDTVVWSDGDHMTYVLPGAKGYGERDGKYGFYACLSEARSAGFQPAQD